MASHNRLVNEVLKMGHKIGLQIKELQWPKLLGMPIHDVTVKFSLYGNDAAGRGMSTDSFDDALVKGIGECIERVAWSKQKFDTSNGFAFHTQEDLAKNNAFKEVIERDAFFCHYLMRSCPIELNPMDHSITKQICTLLKRENVKTQLYLTETVAGFHTVFFLLLGKHSSSPFGLFLGSSCNKDLESAVKKAALEAIRSWASFKWGNASRKITIHDFTTKEFWSPLDHENLYLTIPLEANELFGSTIKNYTKKQGTEMGVKYSTFSLPDPLSQLKNVFVIHCQIEGFQSVYFGPTTPTHVSLPRLGEFIGHKVLWKDINIFPHPFA